jgi:hypothetical protein
MNMEQFLQIDNRIKELNDQLRKLREKRNLLEAHIIKNNIQHSQCKIVDAKSVEPLTFRYLEKTLGEIIPDKQQLQKVIDHLKQRRKISISREIKRLDL